MQIQDVLIPVAIFASLGIIFGIILAVASRIFAVKTDERIGQITELLPGANCGGCGYSGCAALADAIVKGEASPNACKGCSPESIRRIGEWMGIETETATPVRAHVLCAGNCQTAIYKYRYEGAEDCVAAEKLGGGSKACPNGCIGLGSCVAACKYDAIHVVDGLAVVDKNKCIGCGACAARCPKQIITMIPVSAHYVVDCRSTESGAITRKQCTAGCIACKLCEKNCPVGAISVTNGIAAIDQSKCISCGKCAEKCPRKIIKQPL